MLRMRVVHAYVCTIRTYIRTHIYRTHVCSYVHAMYVCNYVCNYVCMAVGLPISSLCNPVLAIDVHLLI